MSKIIINNISDLPDSKAIGLVECVIEAGRISNFNKQYCYLMTFSIEGISYSVSSDLNKKSDKFTIYNYY